MPGIAHLGDPISHGGSIITASPDVVADSRQVARVGDLAVCSRHGLVRIVTGADTVRTNGRASAHDGSRCSCGAVVQSFGRVRVEEGA
ncbi:MAG: PAAR domain-containing protein [Chromatiales bacterium]|nr:PAAR domain-containing protein [Chromatiales bacterium]